MKRLLQALGPFLGLLLVAAFFYALPPHLPVGALDFQTMLVQTVIVGTTAFGMTLVIVSGGIDLSVGSSIALSSVTAAMVLRDGGSPWLAAAAAVLTGGLCGVYNGLLITGLRLPPFIATLGTLGFYRGVAKWLAGSSPVNAPTAGLERWVQPTPPEPWMLVAPGVWIMLALGLFLAALLRYSVLGRHALAIGSNEATARLCGVPVPRTKVAIYALAGVLTGLAGLFQFARLTQGDPTIAVGVELDVVAAVVIGGGSLSGGQGSMAGTFAGALLMAYLRNRCTALGWPNFVQEMIVGHIIVLAVALDQWRIRRRER